MKRVAYRLLGSILLVTAGWASGVGGAADNESLRGYAEKISFGIGTTIQRRYWNQDAMFKPTLAREFNHAVSIVFMKFTQPERGQYDLDSIDDDMRFARQHNMKLFGATLIYRNDTSPDWLHFNQFSCGGWSAADLDRIMKEHIHSVVRRGGDTYYAWEVVNEPLAPGENGCWSRILGQDEMIAKAFQYAHEANPKALLVLNDTFGQGGVDKERTDRFFALIKRVQKLGGPINVAGCEMHLEAQQLRPNYIDEFKYFLEQARTAGVQAQVTEMDVYQGPAGSVENPYAKQKEIFYNVLHTCLKDSNCTSFTVWGINDDLTWLRTHKGLLDANPVLFDGAYKKKPAYYGVLEALKEGR
jgi:endo-1,4-beta-xylanase